MGGLDGGWERAVCHDAARRAAPAGLRSPSIIRGGPRFARLRPPDGLRSPAARCAKLALRGRFAALRAARNLRGGYSRPNTRPALVPPKPNEFESATRIATRRAWFTT